MDIQKITRFLLIVYFVNLLFYSITSLFDYKLFERIFWFSRIPILLLVYLVSSVKKQWIYILALLSYQVASLFFASDEKLFFLFGSISSVFFKFCLCLLVLDLISKKNRLPILIATIPFFMIYLYIIYFVYDTLFDTFYWWILNAFITSSLGGIAIINYLNNSNSKEYWFLVSSIFFIVQIAAFFVNKFYLKNEAIYQMVILFYGASHYTFYKFLILKEEEESLKELTL